MNDTISRGSLDPVTGLDFLPPDEAAETLADLKKATGGEGGKGGRRGYTFVGNPDYHLVPSQKNPRVRRWMRREAGLPDKLAEHAKQHEGDDDVKLVEVGADSPMHSPAFAAATELASQISEDSYHRDAVKIWAKTEFAIKDNSSQTPMYYPDSHEIVIGKKHLDPAYWSRFNVNGPGIVIAHELAHAWDFSRAQAAGHKGKSYWMSEVAPRLLAGTHNRVPGWVKKMPEFKRMRYAASEIAEMPAVLTEYALSQPEEYTAMARWFKENTDFDLADEMQQFWGTDLTKGVYVSEEKVNDLVNNMTKASKTRFKLPWTNRWRSRIRRQVSYTSDGWENIDPGFIPLSQLIKMTKPVVAGKGEK